MTWKQYWISKCGRRVSKNIITYHAFSLSKIYKRVEKKIFQDLINFHNTGMVLVAAPVVWTSDSGRDHEFHKVILHILTMNLVILKYILKGSRRLSKVQETFSTGSITFTISIEGFYLYRAFNFSDHVWKDKNIFENVDTFCLFGPLKPRLWGGG